MNAWYQFHAYTHSFPCFEVTCLFFLHKGGWEASRVCGPLLYSVVGHQRISFFFPYLLLLLLYLGVFSFLSVCFLHVSSQSDHFSYWVVQMLLYSCCSTRHLQQSMCVHISMFTMFIVFMMFSYFCYFFSLSLLQSFFYNLSKLLLIF